MNLNSLEVLIGLGVSILSIIGMSSAILSRTLKPLSKSIDTLTEATNELKASFNELSKETELHLKDLDYGLIDHEKRIDKIERKLE